MTESESLYRTAEEFQAAFSQYRQSRIQSAAFKLPTYNAAAFASAPKFYDWGKAATHFFGKEYSGPIQGPIKQLPLYSGKTHGQNEFTGWVREYKVFGEQPGELKDQADYAYIENGEAVFTQNNKYDPFTLRPSQITDYPKRLIKWLFPEQNLSIGEVFEDISNNPANRDLILTHRFRQPIKFSNE